MIIVLDTDDLSKSCLLDVRDLSRISAPLGRLCSDATSASQGCVCDVGLQCCLLFRSDPGPEFVPQPLDGTLKPRCQPKSEEGSSEHAVRVKDGHKPAAVASLCGSGKNESRVDWIKAMHSFLQIIANNGAPGLLRMGPEAAMPQIEGIITIAEKYEAIDAVLIDFERLFFKYVGHRKFWEAIAKDPIRYIKVGIALKISTVYEEAFEHLVGSAANFRYGQPYDDLPDVVQAAIERRSRELYHLRTNVNEELLLITVTVEPKESCAKSCIASQNRSPVSWVVVNIFRDWIGEHLGHLREETCDKPSLSELCKHEHDCHTVAGFYRTVAAGGDAYLRLDDVNNDWNHNFFALEDGDEDVVKDSLARLKQRAQELVAPLIDSSLQLRAEDVRVLNYLTCVKVQPEDIPWSTEDVDMDLY